MHAEVLIYDGYDDLDAMAPWEILSGLAAVRDDVTARLVSLDGAGPVTSGHGTTVLPGGALSERPDLLVVPGGGWADRAPEGAWAQAQRGALPAAIAARHAAGTTIASVCTGAMLLAAAGLLEGRPAITHHTAVEDLRASGARVVEARVVDDGDILTAGGVTSGIDLALWILEREFGPETAAVAADLLEHERRGEVWRAAAV